MDGSTTGIDSGARQSGAVTDAPAPIQQNNFKNIEVGGIFNKYTSGYWALALPALSVRYAFEAIKNIAGKLANSKGPAVHLSPCTYYPDRQTLPYNQSRAASDKDCKKASRL